MSILREYGEVSEYGFTSGIPRRKIACRVVDRKTIFIHKQERLGQEVLCDCSAIETELAELHREIEVVSELTRKSIYENARFTVNQDEFNERHQGYIERHRIATERFAELEDKQRNRQNKLLTLERFIREIETRLLVIEEFDEKLWVVAVEKVTVHRNGRLEFVFKDRTCVQV